MAKNKIRIKKPVKGKPRSNMSKKWAADAKFENRKRK